MPSLQERLLSVEEDFMACVIKGEGAMSAFDERWQTLLDDIDRAMESDLLDSDLPTLAYTVASRVAALADTSATLFTSCDTITSELVDQLGTLVSEIVIDDTVHQDLCPIPLSPPKLEDDSEVKHSMPLSVLDAPKASRKRAREDGDPSFGAMRKRPRSTTAPKKRKRLFPSPKSPSKPPATTSDPASNPSSPSCSSSMDETVQVTSSPSPAPRQSRKRRLSDADAAIVHNGCKRLHVGPRAHAVSDSFVVRRSSEEYLVPSKAFWASPCYASTIDLAAPLPVSESDMLPRLWPDGELDLGTLLPVSDPTSSPTAAYTPCQSTTPPPSDNDASTEWPTYDVWQELMSETPSQLLNSPSSSVSSSSYPSTPPVVAAAAPSCPVSALDAIPSVDEYWWSFTQPSEVVDPVLPTDDCFFIDLHGVDKVKGGAEPINMPVLWGSLDTLLRYPVSPSYPFDELCSRPGELGASAPVFCQ